MQKRAKRLKLSTFKGFITEVDKFDHIKMMFLCDYEAGIKSDKTPFKIHDWDQIEKKNIIKEIDWLYQSLEREKPTNQIKYPLSDCKKYITLKCSRSCKIYNLNDELILLQNILHHTVQVHGRVMKYNFTSLQDGQKHIGVYISISKIKLEAL
jgi:hypothetical protein